MQDILRKAVEARLNAHCPYSNFQVGACLLTEDGVTYTGCNVENAAFTVGVCAEKTAYVKAVSEGKLKFTAIAVVAHQEKYITPPCGSCRQFISEFGDVDIYLAKPELGDVMVTSLNELLPFRFQTNPDNSF